MKKPKKVIIPSYAKGFECIGEACEDSCCIGWDIDLDKKTYRHYSKKFPEYIYRNRDFSDREVDYGRISVYDSHRCPFLDDANLCEVYKTIGEEALSNICYSYPRKFNYFNGRWEMSLYMSCPEAVRKLVSSKDPITFSELESRPVKYILSNNVKKDLPWEDLRGMAIKTVQDRSLTIGERVLKLGESILDEKGDPGQRTMDFMRYAVESLSLTGDGNSPYFSSVTETLVDLFSRSEDPVPEQIINSVLKPFIAEHSHMLEHYLVNSIFQDLFPYSVNGNEADGYIALVLRYALLVFYLAGKSLEDNNLVEEDLVAMIQAHDKALSHHRTLTLNLLYEFRRKNYGNREFISQLIYV